METQLLPFMEWAARSFDWIKSIVLDALVSSSSADTRPPFEGLKVSTSYLQWFAGFVDAEGNFLISPGTPHEIT